MSSDAESLHICGNILSTKNYRIFTLRCTECGDSFDQWLAFIKHLDLKHSGGNDDSLKNSVKCEFGDEELIEEDGIKNELESVWEGEDLQDFGSSDIKGESETEIEYAESDSQEKLKKPAKATTIRHERKSKKEHRQLKTFYFNMHDAESKQSSLEFLKVLEEKSLIWDYRHKDYRNIRAREQAFLQIKLHLRRVDYLVEDSALLRIITDMLRDYRKAKEEFALHRKLDKRLQFLWSKCKFLDVPDNGYKMASVINDYEAESDNNDEDDVNNAVINVENPELAEFLICRPNSRFKRLRFHIPGNKLVIDMINLWRENPLLWDKKRSDPNSGADRRTIIESWIKIFKEQHNVVFSYDEIVKNLQLLRRYYNQLKTRKVLDEAAKDIIEKCSFLPDSKLIGKIKCDHCNSFALGETNYKAHLYNEHQIGESPFKCEECGKIFPTSYNLDAHVRSVHTKELDFICTLCNKRFLRKCNLISHMQLHTGEKTFTCETCGKSYRRIDQLKLHETRIHLRQRNFPCTMCPKAFYTKQLLKDHVNAHLNIRNHKCPFCDKGFHSSHALMRHKQIHSEVKRYACKLCDAKFHQFVGLNSHMKNRHSTE